MNNQVFLVIAILFIVMILVDLVFNFTGILQENFNVFSNETYKEAVENAANETSNLSVRENSVNNNEATDLTTTHKINSVIAHFSGTVYGVIPLGERLPTTKVLFLIKKNVALSMDSAGKMIRKLPNKFDENQHFRLLKMNNDDDISETITNGVFLATEGVDYPFYFLQSVKKPDYFITQVTESEIRLEKGRNSSRQRFHVSHEELLTVISDSDRSDKTVKIQLKLDNTSLERILDELKGEETIDSTNVNNNGMYKEFNNFADVNANNMENSYAFDTEDQQCNVEDYIPKAAISSLCGNCDPDKL